MKRQLSWLVGLVAIGLVAIGLLLTVGINGQAATMETASLQAPTQSVSPLPAITATDTALPTPTPVATATPTPTDTPTPTATDMATPTPTPTPTATCIPPPSCLWARPRCRLAREDGEKLSLMKYKEEGTLMPPEDGGVFCPWWEIYFILLHHNSTDTPTSAATPTPTSTGTPPPPPAPSSGQISWRRPACLLQLPGMAEELTSSNLPAPKSNPDYSGQNYLFGIAALPFAYLHLKSSFVKLSCLRPFISLK